MQDTREPMVTWLASALESNAERAKTMVDPKIAAPDGFIANVTSVLLSLCTPFLDPSSDLAFRRIDARCKPFSPPSKESSPKSHIVFQSRYCAAPTMIP